MKPVQSMLFGLPIVGSAFNRLPLLLQSVGRRFLGVLISLYFDDLIQQDWSLLAVETQHRASELFEMFGLPLAPNKRQIPFLSPLQPEVQGSHPFVGASTPGPPGRQSHGYHQHSPPEWFLSGSFQPGQASKLFGCVTLLGQGVFGQVARAGLNAIEDRQYSPGGLLLAPELLQAFGTIQTIIELKPQRLASAPSPFCKRALAASHAVQDVYQPSWLRLHPAHELVLLCPSHRKCSSCGMANPPR